MIERDQARRPTPDARPLAAYETNMAGGKDKCSSNPDDLTKT